VAFVARDGAGAQTEKTQMAKTTKNEVNEANDGWTQIEPASETTQTSDSMTSEPAPAPKKRKAKAEPPVVETPAPEAPKKTRKAKVSLEAEVAPAPAPVEPTPTPALNKGKRTKSSATLQDVFNGYVEALETEGKSEGTIASYRMELALAADDLGLDTPIADITPERVLLFMTSDRVMKKRNGKSKSPLSIDKTRRVLRQALTYAETVKLVAVAPVPELAASH
jgi:hypothetical protein